MRLLRWIAAACSTIKWAVLDELWSWEMRKTGMLPVMGDGGLYTRTRDYAVTFITPQAVPWEGATMTWAVELERVKDDLEETRDRDFVWAKGRLNWLAATDEYPIVLVSMDKLPATLRAADAPKLVSLIRTTSRSGRKRDALGVWDPSTADWSAPASIFEDTVHDSWRGWTGTILPEDRPAIALSIANQVLCGAVPLGA